MPSLLGAFFTGQPRTTSIAYRPGQTSFITPNYNHSVTTVYRDFAMTMITCVDSLEALSFVFHPSDPPIIEPDFPSWALRWDIHTSLTPLGLATSDHPAAANRRPVIAPSSDPSVFIAHGLFFDRVGPRTITLKRADFLDPSLTSLVFSMASHCKVDKDPIPEYPRIVTPITGTSDPIRTYQKPGPLASPLVCMATTPTSSPIKKSSCYDERRAKRAKILSGCSPQ
ncbi:hypothetical protein B0T14DRAFT_559222 [Immersiella caudata]|uniref:Uncharacterized protein n=1 Tax=Immersiella caudata TaxID=314043 RepID=A0AA39XCJ1_9PEZI|nr:hypothetical protein B0T14DRAFT_559222 [Immersiella caudata]